MAQDTEDQKRLRAITDEVEALLKKHDVGGVVLLVTAESAAWLHVLPTWADVMEGAQGVALLLRTNSARGLKRAGQTMHLLACLRDMAHDCTEIYGRTFRAARLYLGSAFEVEHVPLTGRHVDPISKAN